MTDPVIGIDLGTTFSAVAVFRNNVSELIPNSFGDRTTPSCVAFNDNDRLIGKAAVLMASENLENTIFAVKRFIGRDFKDENVQKLLKNFPYKVVEINDRINIKVTYRNEEKLFLPEQISAIILEDLKKSAEAYLDVKITKAVITVPAYFNNAQRQATIDAAELAGFEDIKLINEPTAAALAYGLDMDVAQKVILVFDFGGGTFDISLLRLNNKNFEVIGIDGDPYLGGEDIDNALVEHFAEQFEVEMENIRENKALMRQLKIRCEEVKRFLSSALDGSVTLEGSNLKGRISRALFEEINYEIFEKTIKLVQQLLKEANMSKNDIDDIVLVGGSSRIPIIETLLEKYFEKPINKNINPDECVAVGAAIYAAVQKCDPSPKFKGLKLSDVCPLSLGFALHHGNMHVIIPRNSKIPIEKRELTKPALEDQTEVEIKIYEGERYLCQDNHYLGKIELTEIPKDGHIEVIYEIDENSILHVTAVEQDTQRKNQITIENKGRLTRSEIEKMVEDAKINNTLDKYESERIEVLNQLERHLYSSRRCVEKSFKTGKISDAIYQRSIHEIEESISWLNKNRTASKEDLQKKLEETKTLF